MTESRSLHHDLALLRMVADAKASGLTWAQIGSAIIGRPDAKAAKRHVRMVERAVAGKSLIVAQEVAR